MPAVYLFHMESCFSFVAGRGFLSELGAGGVIAREMRCQAVC